MPAQWTGELIGKMHIERVTAKAMAEELGVTPEYVSMVLNGHKSPNGAEERFLAAFREILRKRGE